MSGDEVLLTVFCSFIAIAWWARWYASVLPRRRFSTRTWRSPFLFLVPPVCAVVLLGILLAWASHDVRADVRYLWMYEMMGLAWLGAVSALTSLFGISPRDDWAERNNRAAIYPVGGALIGACFCFAGSNIGNGPGWWVVVYCALLATGTWFVLWFVLELATNISDTITVERDKSAGLRLAGFLVATGLILGRAVAGDWQSLAATNLDFVETAWPAVLFLIVAVVVERICCPSRLVPVRSVGTCGVLPGLLYLASSLAYVFSKGAPL